MEPQIKFTEEEMKSIEQVQQSYQTMITQFGRLELEKLALEKVEQSLKEEFKKLQDAEKQLVANLTAKYGEGTLNPQTGEFSPAPKVSQ